ncbi:hypothetical protein [Microvirga sp. P5_D2]
MSNVVPFPPHRRLRLICTDAEQLYIPAHECPACKGRGEFLYKNEYGYLASIYCPCGGDDDNRIDSEEPDFGGAA